MENVDLLRLAELMASKIRSEKSKYWSSTKGFCKVCEFRFHMICLKKIHYFQVAGFSVSWYRMIQSSVKFSLTNLIATPPYFDSSMGLVMFEGTWTV